MNEIEQFERAFHRTRDVLKLKRSSISKKVTAGTLNRNDIEKAVGRFSHSRAASLLTSMRRRLNGSAVSSLQEFGENVRQALNTQSIFDTNDREVYAAFLGFYFGPRGNEAKKRKARKPKAQPAIFSPPPPEIKVDPKTGQQAWKF